MERICSRCGNRLSRYNPGTLCFPCQEKGTEAIANGDRRYYEVHDLMKVFGLASEEQVRRRGRAGLIPGRIPGIKAHHYLKEVVDEWIRSGGTDTRKPTSPVQEEAYRRCKKGDHDWLWDEKFDGLAYGTETIHELKGSVLSIRYKRTCYLCGHVEVRPI